MHESTIEAKNRPATLRWPLSLIEVVADAEVVSSRVIVGGLEAGSIVLLRNRDQSRWTGIGHGLTTKVNANIGTSADLPDYGDALHKARIAVKAGRTR